MRDIVSREGMIRSDPATIPPARPGPNPVYVKPKSPFAAAAAVEETRA